jgi:hypothetical protein
LPAIGQPVACPLKAPDRLGEAARLLVLHRQQELERGGILLVEPAILLHQGPRLVAPAHVEQDVGQPPGQLRARAPDQDQSPAPVVDRLVGMLVAEVNEASDREDAEVVLHGRGDRVDPGPGQFRIAVPQRVFGGHQQDPRVLRRELQRRLQLGPGAIVAADLDQEPVPDQPHGDRLGARREQLVEHTLGTCRVLATVLEDSCQPLGREDIPRVEVEGLLVIGDRLVLGPVVARAGLAFLGHGQEPVQGSLLDPLRLRVVDQLAGDHLRRLIPERSQRLLGQELGGLGRLQTVAHQDVQLTQATLRLPTAGSIRVLLEEPLVSLDRGGEVARGPRQLGQELRPHLQRDGVVRPQLQVLVHVPERQPGLFVASEPPGLRQARSKDAVLLITAQHVVAQDREQAHGR